MTPEQLAEIRARAEAATPGPWGEYERDGKHRALYVGSPLGADFEFLAMARTDIPALLDYIEELQANRYGLLPVLNRAFAIYGTGAEMVGSEPYAYTKDEVLYVLGEAVGKALASMVEPTNA